MYTNYFQSFRARVAAPTKRHLIVAVGVGAVSSALFLSGCGQNFEQDGGALPVPRSSNEGLRLQTPVANPNAPTLVGPGYAPPHSEGPTQTAVPNIPGGKY